MAQQSSQGTKRAMVGRPSDWVKRFDVDDYVDNPPLIEKLFEEKQLNLQQAMELEKKLASAERNVHQLELEHQTLSHELNEASRRSFFMFAVSVLAILLVGLGINVVTDAPTQHLGWALIVGGVAAELIGFFLRPRGRNG